MKKVLLVTEQINPPYDEGIKKTVYNLFVGLEQRYIIKVICREGFNDERIKVIETNRLFISNRIKKTVKKFRPHTLIYFPFASTTFASFVRNVILSSFCSSAQNIMVALQPKQLATWQTRLIRFLKPKIVLTPSLLLYDKLKGLKINSSLIPLPTNLENFSPNKNDETKKVLRIKYHIPPNKYVITHIGHFNEGRNLKSLVPLQKGENQVIIVGSSSTPRDSIGPASLKEKLLNTGIMIIDGFIERIEEIYHLSDLYIFPVVKKNSSIDLPLSILEARACGVPVVTTNFGSTEYFLGNDNGNIFYSEPEEFPARVEEVKKLMLNKNNTSVGTLNGQFEEILFSAIDNGKT
ncbi:MAG TPA: glycosyltransferase [Candidatus Cloacimonas acidaminovorans]|nr:MAG: Glycosyl transferases group 1 [Bacteroidetes bacterium ADurb.Bin008]HQC08446.1 glycosyltransferase [Candidatus Cloacimonas acidaminovorans]